MGFKNATERTHKCPQLCSRLCCGLDKALRGLVGDLCEGTRAALYISKRHVWGPRRRAINFFLKSALLFAAPVRVYYMCAMWTHVKKKKRKKRKNINQKRERTEYLATKYDGTGSRWERHRQQSRVGELTISVRWISTELHYSIKTKLRGVARKPNGAVHFDSVRGAAWNASVNGYNARVANEEDYEI